MVHAAGNRTTADGDVGRVGVVGVEQAGKVGNLRIGVDDHCRIVADRAGDRRQVTERLREHALQRANDDRRRVDHQDAAVIGLDQVGDGLAAAATGHVLVGRLANKAGLGQRLASATGRSVPAAAGAAGDQKVDFFDLLVAVSIGCAGRQGECCGAKRRGEQFQHMILPNAWPVRDRGVEKTTPSCQQADKIGGFPCGNCVTANAAYRSSDR